MGILAKDFAIKKQKQRDWAKSLVVLLVIARNSRNLRKNSNTRAKPPLVYHQQSSLLLLY